MTCIFINIYKLKKKILLNKLYVSYNENNLTLVKLLSFLVGYRFSHFYDKLNNSIISSLVWKSCGVLGILNFMNKAKPFEIEVF